MDRSAKLDDERQIDGYLVVRQTLVDFSIAQLTILDREWIDRRHHHPLWRLHLLSEFLAARNHSVVIIDPAPQILPRFGIRTGKVEVTAPRAMGIFSRNAGSTAVAAGRAQ